MSWNEQFWRLISASFQAPTLFCARSVVQHIAEGPSNVHYISTIVRKVVKEHAHLLTVWNNISVTNFKNVRNHNC
jgi:hypothetical protein